jgi:hypothetical protein
MNTLVIQNSITIFYLHIKTPLTWEIMIMNILLLYHAPTRTNISWNSENPIVANEWLKLSNEM